LWSASCDSSFHYMTPVHRQRRTTFTAKRIAEVFACLFAFAPLRRIFRSAAICLAGLCLFAGCTTIRVVDPPRTADLDFLLTGAAEQAVAQLSTDSLRDRVVYVDTSWLIPTVRATVAFSLENELARQPAPEYLFLIGELRAKLLKSGVRLVDAKEKAQVVLEIRAGALSTDHLEYLLGLPASLLPANVSTGLNSSGAAGITFNTPQLSILQSTKQYGWASVSYVAYWADSGELLAVSGPFIGRTSREDYWIFGTGPRTIGNIPPAQK